MLESQGNIAVAAAQFPCIYHKNFSQSLRKKSAKSTGFQREHMASRAEILAVEALRTDYGIKANTAMQLQDTNKQVSKVNALVWSIFSAHDSKFLSSLNAQTSSRKAFDFVDE